MAVLYSRVKNAINIYDLGHAHGRSVYADFASFKKAIIDIVELNKDVGRYIAVTNSGQTTECKWMTDIGFTSTPLGNSLTTHTATYEQLCGGEADAVKKFRAEALARDQQRIAEHEAALAARPRRADGRLLRTDGFVVRRPYEFFVGDRVRWRKITPGSWRLADWKEGTIRTVNEDGSFRTYQNTIDPRGIQTWNGEEIQLVERAQ